MISRRKYLIIAPSWVGDLIISQALFKFLKKQNKNCSIDVLSNKVLHPILKHMPEVDNYLSLPFEHGELNLFGRFRIAKELRKRSYTHSCILPNSFKSALIPFWANIPIRTGWLGEFRYILLNNIKLSAQKTQRMVDRFVTLGIDSSEKLPNKVSFPQLIVSQKQLEITFSNLKIVPPKRPILAICPGAEYGAAKRWPASYFAEVAKVKKSEGWEIWIFGGPKDKYFAQEIQNHSENTYLDLTGRTNLGEAIDLLSLVTIVLTNDSGLMHIAAALSIPLVAIYGSTLPAFTPPLTNKRKILSLNLACSPCFKRECPLKHVKCLRNLQPKLVLRAIDEFNISVR